MTGYEIRTRRTEKERKMIKRDMFTKDDNTS